MIKKIIIILVYLLIGLITGVSYNINTLKISVTEETQEGILLYIETPSYSFDYYVDR